MSYAIVAKQTVPLQEKAGFSAQVDEVLPGMALELLSPPENGWCKVRAPWGRQGFAQAEDLMADDKKAREWKGYGKMMARAPFVDVLAEAGTGSVVLACLPRGGLVHPVGAEDEKGFLPVELPGGEKGFVKGGNMMPELTGHGKQEEGSLREALATSALSYLGAQYRKGGRTMLGVDDAGLVSMAYLINGILLESENDLAVGGALHSTTVEALGMGDVIFFAGHVVMYLGDGMYVHATDYSGSDGVVLNSLEEGSTFFRAGYGRADIKQVGSLFPK